MDNINHIIVLLKSLFTSYLSIKYITIAVAVFGAITGLFALILNYKNYRINRSKFNLHEKRMQTQENRNDSLVVKNYVRDALGFMGGDEETIYLPLENRSPRENIKIENARKILEEALLILPKNQDALYYMGVCNTIKNNFEKAIEFFDRSIESDPEYAKAYNGKGIVYKRLLNYEKAVDYYKKAISIDCYYPNPYNNLGNIYKTKNQFNKALDSYKKAIEIDPYFHQSYTGIANLLLENRKYQEAKKYYIKARNIYSRNPEIYNGLGIICLKNGDFNDALELFTHSLSLNDSQFSAFYNLGCTYKALRDYDNAAKNFYTAIQIDQKEIKVLENLSYVLENSRNKELAVKILRKLFKMDSNYDHAAFQIGREIQNYMKNALTGLSYNEISNVEYKNIYQRIKVDKRIANALNEKFKGYVQSGIGGFENNKYLDYAISKEIQTILNNLTFRISDLITPTSGDAAMLSSR